MIVDETFLPTKSTAEYLYKNNYTRPHIWDIVKKFRIYFKGQEFQNIQEKFKTVMKKEFATGAPQKPIEDCELDLSHRSEDSIERADEVKQTAHIMSRDEAINWYNQRRGNIHERSQ